MIWEHISLDRWQSDNFIIVPTTNNFVLTHADWGYLGEFSSVQEAQTFSASMAKKPARKKKTRVIEFDGLTFSVDKFLATPFAKKKGLKRSMLYKRLLHGVSGQELFSPPISIQERLVLAHARAAQRTRRHAVNGQLLTAREISKLPIAQERQLSLKCIQNRIYAGKTGQQLLIPKKPGRQKKC